MVRDQYILTVGHRHVDEGIMKNFLNNIEILFYLFILEILFILLKFDLFIGILIWPFMYYYLAKKLTIKQSLLVFPIIGFMFFSTIYFYGFKPGYEIFLAGLVLSILTFTISGVLTSLILKKYFKKKHSYKEFFLFPSIFLLSNFVFFQILYDATYLMEIPVIFQSFFPYVPLVFQTFFIMIFSTFLIHFIINKKKFVVAGMLGLFFILYGFNFIGGQDMDDDSDTIIVASIQKNHLEGQKFYDNFTNPIAEYHLNQTIIAAKNGANVVVWPEYTIKYVTAEEKNVILDKLVSVSKLYDVVIVSGIFGGKELVRYNSVIVVDPVKGLLEEYRAQEFYSALGDLQKGTSSLVYETRYGNFFVLVCFEALVKDVWTDYASNEDLDYFFIISNNKFMENSPVLKTLEWNYKTLSGTLNLPLVATTNNGPSIQYNEFGREENRTKHNEETILYSRVKI